MKQSTWMIAGAVGGLLAVAAGAFGDHLLRDRIMAWYGERGPRQLENWQTASRYLMYHSLALVVLGGLAERLPRWGARWIGTGFVLGCLLFCGGLFGNVLTAQKWLVHIVPLGGVAFLSAWLGWALAACRTRSSDPV